MAHSEHDDLIWQAAMRWVMLEHEQAVNDPGELISWLNANPQHRAAYEEARTLWLLTGLIPPATLEISEQPHLTSDQTE